jgi:hypothetical protein
MVQLPPLNLAVMKNRKWIFFVLISVSIVAKGQMTVNEQSGVTLGEINGALMNLSIKAGPAASVQVARGFDFHEFKLISGAVQSDDFFKVGFDEKGKVYSIEHREKIRRLGNFRLSVFHFPTFRLISLEVRDGNDEDYYFLPVIFVNVLADSTNFMVNLLPQFGPERRSDSFFDGPLFGINTISDYSAIMALDRNLYPTKLLRLHKGKIALGSEIMYDSNSHKLVGEKLFFFNLPEQREWRIDKETPIAGVFSALESCCPFTATVTPKIRASYATAPLWFYGGSHFFK